MFENASLVGDPEIRQTMGALALGFMVLEYMLGRLARHDTHDLRESAASIGVAIGQSLVKLVEAGLVALPFMLLYEYRLFEIAFTPLSILALFFAVEFAFYWQHRASHRVRWLWATHVVHHSATRYNLTAAVRLGWTGAISGQFLFYLPLVWIGFHPVAVIGMLAINLVYQFFLHSELAPRLGPLEWVLNTPNHHRVHHASNGACLDRNYGGMLIIFDRLFGTFAEAPKHEPLRYGVVGATPSLNPLRIAFGEWIALIGDARRARGWRARLGVLFGAPGAKAPEPPVVQTPAILGLPAPQPVRLPNQAKTSQPTET